MKASWFWIGEVALRATRCRAGWKTRAGAGGVRVAHVTAPLIDAFTPMREASRVAAPVFSLNGSASTSRSGAAAAAASSARNSACVSARCHTRTSSTAPFVNSDEPS